MQTKTGGDESKMRGRRRGGEEEEAEGRAAKRHVCLVTDRDISCDHIIKLQPDCSHKCM